MSSANYDGRTALHLAAAEGHASCVKFLVETCKLNPLAKDRYRMNFHSIRILNNEVSFYFLQMGFLPLG